MWHLADEPPCKASEAAAASSPNSVHAASRNFNRATFWSDGMLFVSFVLFFFFPAVVKPTCPSVTRLNVRRTSRHDKTFIWSSEKKVRDVTRWQHSVHQQPEYLDLERGAMTPWGYENLKGGVDNNLRKTNDWKKKHNHKTSRKGSEVGQSQYFPDAI